MAKWWNKRRLDLIEVGLIVLLTGIAASVIDRAVALRGLYAIPLESETFATKYGPGRYSENYEEWIIRDFFEDRRDGVFVDIGANDYKHFSNTFFLESRLGWSGIAVDPQAKYEADYRKYRPRTRFFALFVSDTSSEGVKVYVSERFPLVTSGSREFTERWQKDAKEVSVPSVSLTDLLDQTKVGPVDLLSIDVETFEPHVLAGFDIDRFQPTFVCIEAHPEVRQQILDYFTRHRYVVAAKYLRADTKNLYFTPLK